MDKEIRLKKGAAAVLKFRGMGTAGYEWNYVIKKNKDLVEVSKDYAPLGDQGKKIPGASAEEIFTLRALKPGVALVNFFQSRSWEKKSNPADQQMVRVIIE